MELRRSRWFGAALASTWLVCLYLVLPLMIVIPVSLTDRRFISMPQDGISFRHYANLINNPLWMSSIGQSLIVATVATIIAVILGTLATVGCWRISSKRSELVRAALLLPLFIPSIIHALGMYRMWIDVGIIDTFTGVILADVITAIPYVVITVSASLANFDVRLEQAARNLGANARQVIWLVVLPNVRTALASGALFAFMHSWDDLLLVLFIAGRVVYTLPRRMWDGIHYQLDPTMAAVAVVLIAMTTLFLSFDLFMRRRRI